MVSPLRMALLFAWSLADVDLFSELSTACLFSEYIDAFFHFAVHWCLCICNKPADTLIKYINRLYYNAAFRCGSSVTHAHIRKGRGGKKKSATHIKYNLLDLIKMNNIKSQDVKTHKVLVYKAENMLFGHLAHKPLTYIQTVIYWNMDTTTTVSHTVTYNTVNYSVSFKVRRHKFWIPRKLIS